MRIHGSSIGFVFALALLSFGAGLWVTAAHLHASLDSEGTCVGLTVDSSDGNDPGTLAGCNSTIVLASSSSASSIAASSSSVSSTSSTSSASSSDSSVASTVASSASGQGTGGIGGRHGTIPRSESRIGTLLHIWAQRNSAHPSAPSVCVLPYLDVPIIVWFRLSVVDFFCDHLLTEDDLFRPADNANRAEMAALLTRMYGTTTSAATTPFTDVRRGSWYETFVAQAAAQGWMRGYGNCAQKMDRCFARPQAPITRAEAAAMMVRYGSLRDNGAPVLFTDVPSYAWYISDVRIASQQCLLQGDDGAHLARPEDNVNRAEMVAMLWRLRALTRGQDVCHMLSALAPTEGTVQANVDGMTLHGEENTMSGSCGEPSVGCLASAALSDATTFGRTLLASNPTAESIASVPDKERMLWVMYAAAFTFLNFGTIVGAHFLRIL